MTQSYFQHRWRAVLTASSADFPGRYPYESAWNFGSTRGSRTIFATVCATRSETVGIPNVLISPLSLGIATVRTGGGKYVPEDIRFQIRYRLLDRKSTRLNSSHIT